MGAWFRRKEVDSVAAEQLDSVARSMHHCAVFCVSHFAR